MRPYGQHFLYDKNLLQKIIQLANVSFGQCILEIGPGKGALTEYLLQAGCEVLAVEIDRKLAADLSEKFKGQKFELLSEDALKSKHALNPRLSNRLRQWSLYSLVSNLPYGAGTPILLNLFQSDHPPATACVMVQKEVGQKLVAQVGDKAYGGLSVLMSNVSRSDLVLSVPPQCFVPPPQVDSCLVTIESHPPCVSPGLLQPLVREAFSQRRKQIRRLTKKGYLLEACGLDPQMRPEEIPAAKWYELARSVNSD